MPCSRRKHGRGRAADLQKLRMIFLNAEAHLPVEVCLTIRRCSLGVKIIKSNRNYIREICQLSLCVKIVRFFIPYTRINFQLFFSLFYLLTIVNYVFITFLLWLTYKEKYDYICTINERVYVKKKPSDELY